MTPIRFDPDALASVLPPGGLTYVSGSTAESGLMADAVMTAGLALGAMTFTGVFIPGINRRTYIANDACRMLSFFMTPELRALGDKVDFLPLCYEDIRHELKRRKPAAALFMCAPPDDGGNCSFGVQVDFLSDLWRDIPVRIAHINPSMPVTRGCPGIPFSEITAWCEADRPLVESAGDSSDAIAAAIAEHIHPYIGDGSTLQFGVGKIPGTVLRRLTDRRGLRMHSGLVDDAVLDLIAADAMAPGASATVGVAVGSRRLYDALGADPFLFAPVSVTHGAAAIAKLEKFVTINSALEIDLFGQGYSELQPGGLMSGPGGASDYARGARLAGGLRIIALPSDGKKGSLSRIIAPGRGRGPVLLGRMDIDLVVTEHGVADLRAKGYDARAEALIAVAAPQFRDALGQEWAEFRRQL